jgi:hypothetical protein
LPTVIAVGVTPVVEPEDPVVVTPVEEVFLELLHPAATKAQTTRTMPIDRLTRRDP